MKDLKFAEPAPAWRYTQCAAEGCIREPRTYSRWCTMHARRVYRTRDPNGRVLKHRELQPHRELAEDFLERRKDHPAVMAAHEYMAALLESPALPEELRKHMARLREGRATPREMLVAVLAVYGLGEAHPLAVASHSCESMNIGRAVLGVRPYAKRRSRNGKVYSAVPRGRVSEALGDRLRNDVGLFATTFVRHIRNALDAPYKAADKLRDASREFWAETAGEPEE